MFYKCVTMHVHQEFRLCSVGHIHCFATVFADGLRNSCMSDMGVHIQAYVLTA